MARARAPGLWRLWLGVWAGADFSAAANAPTTALRIKKSRRESSFFFGIIPGFLATTPPLFQHFVSDVFCFFSNRRFIRSDVGAEDIGPNVKRLLPVFIRIRRFLSVLSVLYPFLAARVAAKRALCARWRLTADDADGAETGTRFELVARNAGSYFSSVKIVNAGSCEREKDDCRDLQKKSLQFTVRA
jgi:hypothetical protein